MENIYISLSKTECPLTRLFDLSSGFLYYIVSTKLLICYKNYSMYDGAHVQEEFLRKKINDFFSHLWGKIYFALFY